MIFAIALLAAFSFRFHIITNVRPCLDGDESAVGVMAYHIQDHGEHPLFLYGQNHGGGHSIEAHIAAALNSVFDRSPLHLRIIPVVAFSLLAAFAALLALRAAGPVAGAFVGLHLAFAPQLMRTSLMINGYMETMLLMLICCGFIYLKPADDPDNVHSSPVPKWTTGLLLGFLCGLAYWWAEFSAVMTLTLFLAAALSFRRRAIPALAAWIIAFPIGAAPLVFDNLKNNFLNIRHMTTATEAGATYGAPPTLLNFFIRELPAFFQNDNAGYYPPGIPWTAWLLFGATAVGLAAAAYFAFAGKKNKQSPESTITPFGKTFVRFAMCYIALYAAIYLMSPFRGETARHFVPMEPYLTILLAVGAAALWNTHRAAPRIIAIAIFAAALIADTNAAALAFRFDSVPDGKSNVTCKEGDELLALLQSRGDNRVFSTRFVRWMIIYRSNEEILAADTNITPANAAWTEFEAAVSAETRPVPFVFNRKDNHSQWLISYLLAHGISYSAGGTDTYSIIRPMSRVSQIDFKAWSRKNHRLAHGK